MEGEPVDAQQARERAYALLLENLSGMAYRCRNDREWTVELVTSGSERLTGYRPDELIANRVTSLGALVHPDDAEPLWAKCQANLAARRPCSNEYRLVTRAGETRWVLDVAHGVYDTRGELVAIEGFITDVTARKRIEEQLAHAQRLDGLGRLAGGVAHDFNNVLTVIVSLVSMVARTLPDGAPQREDLDEVLRAALRAGELTRGLLAFARKQTFEPRPFDLDLLVLEIERLLRGAVGKEVELVTALAGARARVVGDPAQFEQVLVNLAINARHAMPDGGRLTIATRLVAPPADAAGAGVDDVSQLELTVADTGAGMSEETRRRAFEPFFTTKSEGSGLGLATCYGIVQQAGGTIALESAPGAGTVVRIVLPVERGAT